METIFDYNPTKEELARFGITEKNMSWEKKLLQNSPDDRNYQLGILFSSRGDSAKSVLHFAKIKNKQMLGTLIQDF